MALKISKMKIEHLARVAVLAEQLGYPVSLLALRKRFANASVNKNISLLVALNGEVVVGWIHMEILNSLIYEKRVEIRALIVDENHRGKKVGKALVDYAKKWSYKKKIKILFLRTSIKREHAHRFYEREGFVKTKTSYKYEFSI